MRRGLTIPILSAVFINDSLLTDSAWIYMTCHNYSGHAMRTDYTNTESKTYQVCFFNAFSGGASYYFRWKSCSSLSTFTTNEKYDGRLHSKWQFLLGPSFGFWSDTHGIIKLQYNNPHWNKTLKTACVNYIYDIYICIILYISCGAQQQTCKYGSLPFSCMKANFVYKKVFLSRNVFCAHNFVSHPC